MYVHNLCWVFFSLVIQLITQKENAKYNQPLDILDLLSLVLFKSQIPINPHQNEHISNKQQVAENAQVINEDKLQLQYVQNRATTAQKKKCLTIVNNI